MKRVCVYCGSASGAGAPPIAGIENVAGLNYLTITIERSPVADASWDIETSTTLQTWAPATLDITARTTLANGAERITLRETSPFIGTREFLHAKLTVQP